MDDAGAPVGIRRAAWQLPLGYQFDWNPWVQEIGAQGTFAGIGCSQSCDLAAVSARGTGKSATSFTTMPTYPWQ